VAARSLLRVEIRWLDSGAWRDNHKGWQTREAMQDETLSEVSTVGWLAGEDDDTYYVASSHINDTLFNGIQLIYKPNVTSVTRLRARTLDADEETTV
jgi:allantoicase